MGFINRRRKATNKGDIGMSDKYIIKNCPAIYGIDDGFLCSDREDDESEKYCYDCTDCVLKQIVRLCKEVNTKFYDSVHQRYLSPSKAKFARQILELLDIQECG